MTGRLYFTSATADEPTEELSVVALKRAVLVPEEDRVLPAGASGTVVAVVEGGAAYVIEFTEPFAALVDLVASDFTAVSGMAHRAS